MANSIVEIILYIVCFVLSFYAISAVQFDKFCRVKQPAKVTLLMFYVHWPYRIFVHRPY